MQPRPLSLLARSGGRRRGNALVVSFLLVGLITALATAHFATVQKNVQASSYIGDRGDLRRHADTGINLAVHELTYLIGNGDGNIGTGDWVADINDLGRDNRAGTGDEGEGDGIPTPGEPNLVYYPIGPYQAGASLFVNTTDTAWTNVKRIVSTAVRGSTYTSLEVYAQITVPTKPKIGAVYLQPGVVLDLKGNRFVVDGNDTNPDGTPGPEPAAKGISTAVSDPAGNNMLDLIAQVPSLSVDQVIGEGGNPSIGETAEIDFEKLYKMFKGSRKNIITPGTYTDVEWGNYDTNDLKVSYCDGDVHSSGAGKGAGVLVIDGNLTLSGQFDFVGLVFVRGDVRMTGGGSGIHIYGSLLIGQSLSAIDPDLDLTMTGTADAIYSSVAVAKAMTCMNPIITVVYWNEIK